MIFQVGDDGVVSEVNEDDLIYVDKNELEELIDKYTHLEEENEKLKCSNKDAWNLIQFIYNEIKEDGSMDFGRIKDLVELE